jgi:hypothetical protein
MSPARLFMITVPALVAAHQLFAIPIPPLVRLIVPETLRTMLALVL